jgi:hypothetical protein
MANFCIEGAVQGHGSPYFDLAESQVSIFFRLAGGTFAYFGISKAAR